MPSSRITPTTIIIILRHRLTHPNLTPPTHQLKLRITSHTSRIIEVYAILNCASAVGGQHEVRVAGLAAHSFEWGVDVAADYDYGDALGVEEAPVRAAGGAGALEVKDEAVGVFGTALALRREEGVRVAVLASISVGGRVRYASRNHIGNTF
jgi:hypothetical protein